MNENNLLKDEEAKKDKIYDQEFIEQEIELLSSISFLLVSAWG